MRQTLNGRYRVILAVGVVKGVGEVRKLQVGST
jgi:hypothetical protein